VANLIEELLGAGVNVQLRHMPDTETNFADTSVHGYVALFDGEKQLAKREGFQHNRKLRNGGSWDSDAVKELVAEVMAAVVPKSDKPDGESVAQEPSSPAA